jgi:hypothetical protein
MHGYVCMSICMYVCIYMYVFVCVCVFVKGYLGVAAFAEDQSQLSLVHLHGAVIHLCEC